MLLDKLKSLFSLFFQTKVDEERQFFEAEQKISGDKLNELLEKMREYEEQYANQVKIFF